ncbi:sortase [Microbacteriaceae bacterium]|nr:sortase [Candidatus Saccharibacteria bacterium]
MSAIKMNIEKVPLLVRVVPLYVVFGALFFFTQAFFPQSEKIAATIQQPISRASAPSSDSIISGRPNRIVVESLGIDLFIKDGTYNPSTKEWTLSNDIAYFAEMTTPANNSHGSTFIYGHNTEAIFAKFKNISSNVIVKIYTTNGHIFEYTYRNDAIVTPNITNVLYENPESPQLTVMTCEGAWSKVRRIMYFDFKVVS